MGQYKNEWGEISQIIEEHINLMIGMHLETGGVFKCISAKIGFFPYAQCLGKVLMDKDWNRLNNLIYQENCFRSLCSLMCGDTHYWALLEMLEALAVGNMKTMDLLVPHKTEPVTHIFPAYRPATDMLIGLWRKDNSVLDYAVPRAKKFVSGKRPPVYGTKNCFSSYPCQIIKFFPKNTLFGEIHKKYILSYLQNILNQ